MLKNLTLYSVVETLDPEALNESLGKLKFRPCSGLEAMSAGFVPFADGVELIHSVSGLHVGAVRVDKKTLPASAVKQLVKEKCAEVEEQQGYKPGRKQAKEIKEQIIDNLMPRAIPATKTINFMFTKNMLMIDATSAATADIVIGLLAKCMDPFPIGPLHTDTSPGGAMTNWLVDDEAPEGFTIDQEVEMKSPNKALVRWANETVRHKEAHDHTVQGKQCTKMALTWRDKYSFVLNDKLVVSRLKALDMQREETDEIEENDVDGTVALYGAEIQMLANDLVDALGGLMKG